MKKAMEKSALEVQRADHEESREELLNRVRTRVKAGFYGRTDVLRDVADALFHNPSAFENLP